MRLRKESPVGNKVKKQKREKQMLAKQQEAEINMKKQAAQQKVDFLQQTGIFDAYQYFLRQAVEQGLPPNIFEYAAQKVLKYQKLMKLKESKKKQLNEFNTAVVREQSPKPPIQ